MPSSATGPQPSWFSRCWIARTKSAGELPVSITCPGNIGAKVVPDIGPPFLRGSYFTRTHDDLCIFCLYEMIDNRCQNCQKLKPLPTACTNAWPVISLSQCGSAASQSR